MRIMEMSTGAVMQIAVYLISIGTLGGTILTKIGNLEKKVDKHNGVIERMYRCEESLKSAHHRIDELREGLK